MDWNPLKIGTLLLAVPIIQGGMGVGVSMAPLARAVAARQGLGTLSSACLDRLVSERIGRKVGVREACEIEVREAKEGGLPVAMNVMMALASTYDEAVLGSMDGGVDVIISGAGLPLKLPSVVATHPRADQTALVPIVSSGRALDIVCKRWKKAGRLPDAVVVEGPLAGGHLGWRIQEEIDDPSNRLENLIEDVKPVAEKYGGFPIIAAGGIYTHEDIDRILSLGADGVQLGTRFLATEESDADDDYKRAVVAATSGDIEIAFDPGSPCGMPFRTLKDAPMYAESLDRVRKPLCDKGYLLFDGTCKAKDEPDHFFCICNGLLSSAGYNSDKEAGLYTVGANADRVDRIMSVDELMDELTGKTA